MRGFKYAFIPEKSEHAQSMQLVTHPTQAGATCTNKQTCGRRAREVKEKRGKIKPDQISDSVCLGFQLKAPAKDAREYRI